jgi:hypothetical protein
MFNQWFWWFFQDFSRFFMFYSRSWMMFHYILLKKYHVLSVIFHDFSKKNSTFYFFSPFHHTIIIASVLYVPYLKVWTFPRTRRKTTTTSLLHAQAVKKLQLNEKKIENNDFNRQLRPNLGNWHLYT